MAAAGGLLVGERVALKTGEALTICGRSLVVMGRLGRTGVGPFDESYFITFSALDELVAAAIRRRALRTFLFIRPRLRAPEGVDATHHDHAAGRAECLPSIAQDRVSAFLLQLSPGASAEQARFAIGQIPAIKIVTGNPIFTAARQSLGSLFWGVAIFAGLADAGAVLSRLAVVFRHCPRALSRNRRAAGHGRAAGADHVHHPDRGRTHHRLWRPVRHRLRLSR